MEEQIPAGFICLAVYRPDAELFERQIRSIQEQTVPHWQCLIGIDGTDEDARKIVQTVVGDDERFRIREYPNNVGFYRNFERLLLEVPSSAAWVAMSDQDDEWFPHKLETLVPSLCHSSLVIGQAVVVRADGSGERSVTRRRSVPLVAELVDNQVTGSACMLRRDLLDIALPFPAATDLAFHDHWLGVCALVAEGIAALDEPLQFYLQHDSNVIGEEGPSGIGERLRILHDRSDGWRSALRYLADHRWGWRVNMARALTERSAVIRAHDARIISRFSRGSASMRLVIVMLTAVLKRQAPLSRTIGLILGALSR